MCGIAGILARHTRATDSWHVLARMSRTIGHRGPDGHGYFVSGPIGLAHRRLSIIDVVGGRQPMIDQERGHVFAYNGELYNFLSLRAELESRGSVFTTRSDTEVFLRLACSTSFDWLKRLNGMFAFALWAEGSRQLILGRDRLGIKPLFYAALPDEFVFASEIKALLQHPGVQRVANVDRVPEYLAFRSVTGTDTMFKGIHQVPPGHVLVVSQNDLSIKALPFWPPEPLFPSEAAGSDAEIRDRIEFTLRDSVRRQIISDVPVGTFLSGGVDSSLITTFARSFEHDEQLHTFSVGFEEADYDESRFANVVASKIGATHHALVVTEKEYLGELERTVVQLDEPLNHAHTVQLQLLSRCAKSFVTVVLTGEGADELFGGYPRVHIPLLARRLSWLPEASVRMLCRAARLAGLRRAVKLLESAANEREAVVHGARFVPRHDLDLLYPDGAPCASSRETVFADLSRTGLADLNRVLRFDQLTYLPSLLSRLDKTSMAAAVECRVPFLDNDVIDASLSVPSHLKVRVGRENKVVLKQIGAKYLPDDLVYRRKVGFGTPLTHWFRNPSGLGGYLELLAEPSARVAAYVDRRAVSRLVANHRGGKADHAEAIWGLLALELWHRHVLERAVSKDACSHWHGELANMVPIESPFSSAAAFHSGMTV